MIREPAAEKREREVEGEGGEEEKCFKKVGCRQTVVRQFAVCRKVGMYPELRPYPSLMCYASAVPFFSDEAQFKLKFSTGPPSLLGMYVCIM